MSITNSKPAYILSVIIAIMMVWASMGGLFINGLYQGSSVTIAGQTMHGNDTQKLLWLVVNKL